ncbi:MAG: anti-sigma factor [Chloroflexi bacterium]|nr:anti-sigma factor [Chloroflexota bacterium]
MGCEDVFDLLPAYALDTLDAEETYRVADHLAVCRACQEELRSYTYVVEDLPYGVRDREPPPGLKTRILAQARADKAAPRTERGALPARRWSPAWSFISLAVIVLLGLGNLLQWQRASRGMSAATGDWRPVALQGSAGATGLLLISDDGAHGTLVVDGLAVLDEAHQYQLWLIQDGKRTDGGVFSVDEDGYGALWVHSPQPLASYSAIGVTIEPAGGSPGPTGEKVMGGELGS